MSSNMWTGFVINSKISLMKTILILLAGLTLGYLIASYSLSTGKQELKTVKETNGQNPLDSLITLETKKGRIDILIAQQAVYLQPFETGETPYKSLGIKKEDYPKLFSQGAAKQSFIQAEKQEDGVKLFVIISNNQPDHGAYSKTYSLIIDPITGDIKELNNLR